MNIVYISLGSNIGNKENYLEQARDKINLLSNTKIKTCSPIITTKAMDFTEQDDFLNQVIEIHTEFSPTELLHELKSIENSIGRIFRFDKGPREIDLDILLFNDSIVDYENLQIPHHSIQSRPFIKELLLSINPFLKV